MIARLALLIALAAAPAPAFAAGPAPSGPASDGPTELYNAHEEAARRAQAIFADDETCPRNLDAPEVVVPIIEHGVLVAYTYVRPRVCLVRSNRIDHLEKVHLLTDRFLRAAHRAPMVLGDDGTLSRDETRAAMRAAIGDIIAADDVERLDLLGEDIRFLR